MNPHQNLLPQPSATFLPPDEEADTAIARAADPAEAAAHFPAYPAVWADLADRAYEDGRLIDAYAYSRVGYHRGLDALRRTGWKGAGPVPWSHEPNRGFLRCLATLARAAGAIGETDEAARCADLLRECDPRAVDLIDGGTP